MIGIGRVPEIEDLHLDNTGVKLEKGKIVINEHHETTVKGIYALGDSAAPLQLTPTAIRAGRILAERIFNN